MIDMESRTACFTGHRELPTDDLPEISKRLEDTLVKLIEQGYRYFGAGGDLGFDTLAAQVVLRLRERYPQIRLILVLPCLNQTRGWPQADIDAYEEIKRCADKVTYTSEHYFRGCIQKRNRQLVDNSSACICYLMKLRPIPWTMPAAWACESSMWRTRTACKRALYTYKPPELSLHWRTIQEAFSGDG